MTEHREGYPLEIGKKLLELTVKELHWVCEYCAVAGKDHEHNKDKTRCALVKHFIKFCERDELLDREEEGICVLLDLNDQLEALLESWLETDATGSAPLVSLPAISEGEDCVLDHRRKSMLDNHCATTKHKRAVERAGAAAKKQLTYTEASASKTVAQAERIKVSSLPDLSLWKCEKVDSQIENVTKQRGVCVFHFSFVYIYI